MSTFKLSLKISDLPDYPAIQQIQGALWRVGEVRGAAVMIGSGFSRFAARASEDAPMPPLWSDFRREMCQRLGYPAHSPIDALKLAQEFEVSLGSSALDGLIRGLVRDDEWWPGNHHERLLALPWADVLTTNWDTLLERTKVDADGPQYEVVRTVADISRTRSPRIVKLHGSLPSHKPLIFTEEDFRTYPKRFAPFVNTAQQVLLENELCLLGFSGDDPNFIRWAGWVRDQLGASARRIRLIGVLRLSPSRRQMLEGQNISVIDLAPLVEGGDPETEHALAAELFLDALWTAKPKPLHVWSRVERQHVGQEGPTDQQIKSLAEDWKSDRLAYPGWIVAPSSVRTFLRYDTDKDYRTLLQALSQSSDEKELGALLRETLWRYETSLWPLGKAIEEVAEKFFATSARGGLPRSDQVQMLTLLVSEARQRRDWTSFEDWVELLMGVGGNDVEATVAYERALRGRDEFDFAAMSEQVDRIVGRDPIWGLRKANILVELGEPVKAAHLVKETYSLLQDRRRLDPSSIWLLSRQSWTHWIWRSAHWELRDLDESGDWPEQDWPIRYKVSDTDPWDEMHAADVHVQEEHSAARKDASDERRSKFDPGIYTKSKPSTRWLNHTVVRSVDELSRLADRLGLPRTFAHYDIIGGRLARALEVDPRISDATTWLAARQLRSATSGLINERFGRVHVSTLSLELVRELVAALKRSIEFGLPRLADRLPDGSSHWRGSWLERCIRWTELLSRLVVRLTPEEAIEVWRFGMTLGHSSNWAHWWLYEPLTNLMRRALEAIPGSLREQVVQDVVGFPLPEEKEAKSQERHWPEMIQRIQPHYIHRDMGDTGWASRVSKLIHFVRVGGILNRTRATWRLLVIHEASMLTESEQRDFAAALWSRRAAENALPNELELYDHVILLCPEPEAGLAERIFREQVIAPLAKGRLSEKDLVALRGAVSERMAAPCHPTKAEALAMLQATLSREPLAESDGPLARSLMLDDQIQDAIGPCLAEAVLPQIVAADVTPETKALWLRALNDPRRPSLLDTAAEFSRLWPNESDFAVSCVRKALASADQDFALRGIRSVNQFRLAYRKDRQSFPAIFSSDIASACAVRREPGLSWALECARMLLLDGLMGDAERDRIVSGLEFLLAETDYSNWNSDDHRTPSLGLVRRECVRLAYVLKQKGLTDNVLDAWLGLVDDDPVPEVRFSISDLNERDSEED